MDKDDLVRQLRELVSLHYKDRIELFRHTITAAADALSRYEALTDTYVQPVPDKCDRITWRGKYYHLDALKITTPGEKKT